jgi:hypothetical protein
VKKLLGSFNTSKIYLTSFNNESFTFCDKLSAGRERLSIDGIFEVSETWACRVTVYNKKMANSIFLKKRVLNGQILDCLNSHWFKTPKRI